MSELVLNMLYNISKNEIILPTCAIFSLMLRTPTFFSDFWPKTRYTSLIKFGKIYPKIWIFYKFQSAVKIALVDEFKWNLRQMEALGSIFSNIFEFWNFINFNMFYSTLNMDQIRIFRFWSRIRIFRILIQN